MRSAVVVIAFAILAIAFVSADVDTLWPMPSSLSTGLHYVSIAPSGLSFVMSSAGSCQSSGSPAAAFLAPTFTRYQGYIAWYGKATGDASAAGAEVTGNVTQIVVCVTGTDMSLTINTDESYQLSVTADGSFTITAPTVFGALRGIETGSQLIDYDPLRQVYYITGLPIVISDAPRFAWR